MAEQAFDPDKYLNETAPSASAFDPDKYLSETGEPSSKPSHGVAETALEHFGKGASLGYLPQLQAMAEKPMFAVLNAATGSKAEPDDYIVARDKNIARQTEEAKDHPTIAKGSELAGGLATGIAAGGAGGGLTGTLGQKVAQGAIQGAAAGGIYGGLSNPGDVEGKFSPLQLGDRAKNAAIGSAFGGAIGGAAPVIAEGIGQGANYVGDKLRKYAEDTAVNATGATGKQAAEFAPGAGRELLDRGVVKFGDSQSKISQRAASALDDANQQIDASLSKLDAAGVKVDANTIYNETRKTINQMRADPSKADVANNLEKQLENLINSTDAKGTTQFGMQEAENVKRGYNRIAGNWADPEKSQAGKEMYQNTRAAVEDAATAADPTTAKVFTDAKKSYGLLSPIQEAAERRAATTSQSQPGGLLDVAAAGVANAVGGPLAAIPTVVARRVISPRLSSSLATTADSAADVLRKIPQLANLEGRDPVAFQGLISRIAPHLEDSAAKISPPAADAIPDKGPNKWAHDGYANLLEHMDDPNEIQRLTNTKMDLLKDPKTKELLVQASDLKPGTKAMQKVAEQIKARQGG